MRKLSFWAFVGIMLASLVAVPAFASKMPLVKAQWNAVLWARNVGEHRGEILNKVAQTLNIKPGDLRKELASGKTLGQILTENNISKDDFHAKVSAAVKSFLDQKVAANKLTAAKEADLLSKFEAGYAAHIDSVLAMNGKTLLRFRWHLAKNN